MKKFRSVQKKFKNSAVNPSFSGVFKFFIFFNASASSEYLISPSNNSASLSASLELFSPILDSIGVSSIMIFSLYKFLKYVFWLFNISSVLKHSWPFSSIVIILFVKFLFSRLRK